MAEHIPLCQDTAMHFGRRTATYDAVLSATNFQCFLRKLGWGRPRTRVGEQPRQESHHSHSIFSRQVAQGFPVVGCYRPPPVAAFHSRRFPRVAFEGLASLLPAFIRPKAVLRVNSSLPIRSV